MTARIQKRFRPEDSEKNPANCRQLFLFNDNVHSFDYVIESLIEICDHSSVQAEQCTTIAHYKGVCDVKKGDAEKLKEMQMRLIEKGLKAEVK